MRVHWRIAHAMYVQVQAANISSTILRSIATFVFLSIWQNLYSSALHNFLFTIPLIDNFKLVKSRYFILQLSGIIQMGMKINGGGKYYNYPKLTSTWITKTHTRNYIDDVTGIRILFLVDSVLYIYSIIVFILIVKIISKEISINETLICYVYLQSNR